MNDPTLIIKLISVFYKIKSFIFNKKFINLLFFFSNSLFIGGRIMFLILFSCVSKLLNEKILIEFCFAWKTFLLITGFTFFDYAFMP